VRVLSFIVPAHDERASIVATIESIRGSAGAVDHELIVVDDASTDGTGELAERAGARVLSVQHRQISRTRNAGAAAARGDVLVFVDADTRVTTAVVEAVVAAVADGVVGGGAMARFDDPKPLWARLMMPLMTRVYFAMNLAAGCFVFARRDAFDAVGGFDVELFAGEEVEFSRAIKRFARQLRAEQRPANARFAVLRAPVETSSRKLRIHSGWRILGELVRLLSLGRLGVRSRERLSLWYGPRTPDPAHRDGPANGG